ncbi:hypothetical protein BDW74DRAFT_88509 [Aspergillus multicolor]|uniref:ankyrin repeat domain-containing protein n=1 Tax=Aspergillus multicolor TaxID=41759 RepID=UPI003CCE53EC
MSPLHNAILQGHMDTVTSLLPTSVDERDFLRQTPMHLAIKNSKLVSLLIENGHNINATDVNGMTHLMYAATQRGNDVVQLLISKGASVSPLSPSGFSFIDNGFKAGDTIFITKMVTMICSSRALNEIQFCISKGLGSLRYIDNSTYGHSLWHRLRIDCFLALVNLCDDVNIELPDSLLGRGGLMQYVHSYEEAQVLVRRGFHASRLPKARADLAFSMFSLTPWLDDNLTQFLVEQGADIDHTEVNGQNLVQVLSNICLNSSRGNGRLMDSIRVCLTAGSDLRYFQPIVFPYREGEELQFLRCNSDPGPWGPKHFGDLIWALELVFAVMDIQGHAATRKVLCGFLHAANLRDRGITYSVRYQGHNDLCDDQNIPRADGTFDKIWTCEVESILPSLDSYGCEQLMAM